MAHGPRGRLGIFARIAFAGLLAGSVGCTGTGRIARGDPPRPQLPLPSSLPSPTNTGFASKSTAPTTPKTPTSPTESLASREAANPAPTKPAAFAVQAPRGMEDGNMPGFGGTIGAAAVPKNPASMALQGSTGEPREPIIVASSPPPPLPQQPPAPIVPLNAPAPIEPLRPYGVPSAGLQSPIPPEPPVALGANFKPIGGVQPPTGAGINAPAMPPPVAVDVGTIPAMPPTIGLPRPPQ